MSHRKTKPPTCPVHGEPTQRTTCRACNAGYMRRYLMRRRLEAPAKTMWERARHRARRLGVAFALSPSAVVIPDRCPVLDVPIIVGEARSAQSPSLDRIQPAKGYLNSNVRVISDHANRLKADLGLHELRRRACAGRPALRADYAKIAEYVDREALLTEVRKKAQGQGRAAQEWAKIALFLERAFQRGHVT